MHWEQTAPVFRSSRDAYSIVEMPDLFELDGRWYLTWLEDNAYGNRDVLGDAELSSRDAVRGRRPDRGSVRGAGGQRAAGLPGVQRDQLPHGGAP